MSQENTETKNQVKQAGITVLVFILLTFTAIHLLSKFNTTELIGNNSDLVTKSGEGPWQLLTLWNTILAIIILSILGIITQCYFFLEGMRKRRKFDKFRKRTIQKLKLLNPESNPNLLSEVLKIHNEAKQLLISSHYEEDDIQKQLELSRIALHYLMMEKDELERLKKRLIRISKVPA